MNTQSKIFAPSKVAGEKQKIEAYLKGEQIFPTTVEMDLTQRCTRACPGCPYASKRTQGLTLELPFLDRLFSILGVDTPGLVLSGGESTIVPHFPETTALARKKGLKRLRSSPTEAIPIKPQYKMLSWRMLPRFVFLYTIGRKTNRNILLKRWRRLKGFAIV